MKTYTMENSVPEHDDQVMLMVEQTLKRKPDISTEELQEKAKDIDPKTARLTRRQFHAKYPLQVKRRTPGGNRSGRRRKPQDGKAAKASTFAEARLDEVLEDLSTKIRKDFQAALRKDSLSEADAFLVRLSKLRRAWERSARR
jgi:hypothetical protein